MAPGRWQPAYPWMRSCDHEEFTTQSVQKTDANASSAGHLRMGAAVRPAIRWGTERLRPADHARPEPIGRGYPPKRDLPTALGRQAYGSGQLRC